MGWLASWWLSRAGLLAGPLAGPWLTFRLALCWSQQAAEDARDVGPSGSALRRRTALEDRLHSFRSRYAEAHGRQAKTITNSVRVVAKQRPKIDDLIVDKEKLELFDPQRGRFGGMLQKRPVSGKMKHREGLFAHLKHHLRPQGWESRYFEIVTKLDGPTDNYSIRYYSTGGEWDEPVVDLPLAGCLVDIGEMSTDAFSEACHFAFTIRFPDTKRPLELASPKRSMRTKWVKAIEYVIDVANQREQEWATFEAPEADESAVYGTRFRSTHHFVNPGFAGGAM